MTTKDVLGSRPDEETEEYRKEKGPSGSEWGSGGG